jgi:glyoxylase-like metal-dependent hydrolase (beta-lactamase superfamily II)
VPRISRIEVPGRSDIVGLRAANPGPFTLSGTNSWIVGSGPAWVVDPGPALPDHVEALTAELERRGGLAGIALTHDHADHSESVRDLRALFPGTPLAAGRGEADIRLDEGTVVGPLVTVRTPGHAPDHMAFVTGTTAMTGDAVLGEGSVFIFPDPGSLAGYLSGLERLRGLGLEVLCPGHGPLVVDPDAKLTEYIEHRLEREQRLIVALDGGKRTVNELLDEVWDDAPKVLRPAAAVTLAAHLDKLEDERRLPDGVERPSGWPGAAEPSPG